MYAVIASGGKQHRVAEGDVIEVELLGAAEGDAVELRPVLVVDGDTVLAKADDLGGASVSATVLGDVKGPKIEAFTYKNKTNNRKRWGHRQSYTRLEITGITR
jgi:large subunit ribosomal protein L21